MTAFKFKEDVAPDFKVKVDEEAGLWKVTCSGTLDIPNAATVIQEQLVKLHGAVMAAKVPRVLLELGEVEYMNSSGLKCFMAWFLLAEQSKDHRYTVEVFYDPKRSWQAVSFKPMERLAPSVVRLKPHF